MTSSLDTQDKPSTRRHLLGSELATSAPSVSADLASRLLKQHFGLTATCKKIWGEKDAIFISDETHSRFLVKFINPGEPFRVSDMHTRVLQHLERKAPGLPVQRVVLSLDGNGLVSVVDDQGSSCLCRVLTLIPGVQQESVAHTDAQRVRVGELLADMQQALRDFTDVVEDPLTWDTKHVLGLRPLVQYIRSGEHQRLYSVLDRYSAIRDQLDHLPFQATHNDFNPANVIVDETDIDKVSGIIDFGDMVANPTIVDLAVGCAHQVDRGETIPSLLQFLRGYLSRRSILESDIAILPALIRTRMFMRIVIPEYQALLFGDANNFTKNVKGVWGHLDALDRLPEEALCEKISAING